MGRDHRRHQGPGQGLGDTVDVQVSRVQLRVGGGQAGVLRRFAGGHVDGPAAFPVDVLGHVGQQGELGERPDDRDGIAGVDPVEQLGQFGAVDLGTPHPKRFHPGTFDQIEDRLAMLLPDGVAQDRAEQPNVLAHRFGGLAAHLRALHGADRCQDFEGFGHDYQYRQSPGRLPSPVATG